MCFLIRCVTSPHAALLSTACASPSHSTVTGTMHRAWSWLPAMHRRGLLRRSAWFTAVANPSVQRVRCCRVTLTRDRLTPPPLNEHDCVMAQLVSAGKSLLLSRCILSAMPAPSATLSRLDLSCRQLGLQSESPSSSVRACMEAYV